MSKKVKDGFLCEDPNCDRQFKTMAGMRRHMNHAHRPPAPLPPPRSTTERLPVSLPETHILAGGDYLKLGDVFYRVEKHVIKAITHTERTSTVKVETEKLRNSWQINQPL